VLPPCLLLQLGCNIKCKLPQFVLLCCPLP
jgi:hypothetical protein